jgi:hypothetical protein
MGGITEQTHEVSRSDKAGKMAFTEREHFDEESRYNQNKRSDML